MYRFSHFSNKYKLIIHEKTYLKAFIIHYIMKKQYDEWIQCTTYNIYIMLVALLKSH